MPPRRTEYELSVEQELPAAADGAPRRARLTARFRAEADAPAPDEAELAGALRELTERLSRAADAAGVGRRLPESRPDRSLDELLETYRPRQRELVDLLHAEGELTDAEYALLTAHLPEGTRATNPPSAGPPAPSPSARAGNRPVEELLRTYEITSLRQAGAVRARRQISFEEYMALKRHFAPPATAGSGPGPTA